MAHKLIYIPNDDTQNDPICKIYYWLNSLDTQLNRPTNQYTLKVSKVVKPTNKKT